MAPYRLAEDWVIGKMQAYMSRMGMLRSSRRRQGKWDYISIQLLRNVRPPLLWYFAVRKKVSTPNRLNPRSLRATSSMVQSSYAACMRHSTSDSPSDSPLPSSCDSLSPLSVLFSGSNMRTDSCILEGRLAKSKCIEGQQKVARAIGQQSIGSQSAFHEG